MFNRKLILISLKLATTLESYTLLIRRDQPKSNDNNKSYAYAFQLKLIRAI